MKCRECDCCKQGWFESKPNDYVCIGVKEPFVIYDIDNHCTEYPERRKNVTIEDAIAHYKYGISHDIFSEPVISYAKMAIEALEKQIPQKPLFIYGRYYCPYCRENNRSLDYYCDQCRQKIDWE